MCLARGLHGSTRAMRTQTAVSVLAFLAGIAAPALAGGQNAMVATQASSASSSVHEPIAQASVGLLIGLPVGDFSDNVEAAGGFSASMDGRLGQGPFSFGGEIAYLFYGSTSREAPLSRTIPEIVVTVNTDNTILLMHGRLRAQRRAGRLRPYADGLLGFAYIATTSSIEDFGRCVDFCSSLGATNLDDVTWSLGGGAGVQIGFGPPPDRFRLDLSLRYLAGGEANYLKEGAIRVEGDRAFFDVSRSRTSMVTLYVGLAIGR